MGEFEVKEWRDGDVAKAFQAVAEKAGERLERATALLAEAREVLGKYPYDFPCECSRCSWWQDRGAPTLKMIEEFLNPPTMPSDSSPIPPLPESVLNDLSRIMRSSRSPLERPDDDWPPLPDGEVPF